MIVYGASGHAKVIISCLRDMGEPVSAIFDDDISKTELAGFSISGNYNSEILTHKKLIIAIGNNRIRQHISSTVSHAFGIVIHPSALIDQNVQIGDGTAIIHRAVIQADTIIGNHVIVNTMASIDHECIIGDYAHIAPGVILCGNVKIGPGTLIGAGSIVIPNISIGSNCIISAGSVIKHDIPDGTLVKATS